MFNKFLKKKKKKEYFNIYIYNVYYKIINEKLILFTINKIYYNYIVYYRYIYQ